MPTTGDYDPEYATSQNRDVYAIPRFSGPVATIATSEVAPPLILGVYARRASFRTTKNDTMETLHHSGLRGLGKAALSLLMSFN